MQIDAEDEVYRSEKKKFDWLRDTLIQKNSTESLVDSEGQLINVNSLSIQDIGHIHYASAIWIRGEKYWLVYVLARRARLGI